MSTVRVWPRSSEYLCWNCAHRFDTIPVYLPVKRDMSRNLFIFTGNFCSWNCVKSYAFTLNKLKTEAAQYIALFAFLTSHRPKHCPNRNVLKHDYRCPCLDKFNGLDMAEPKERLVGFGGTKSIEEYRYKFMVVEDYNIIQEYFTTEISNVLMKIESRPFLYEYKSFGKQDGVQEKHVDNPKKEEKEPEVHNNWEIVRLLNYMG